MTAASNGLRVGLIGYGFIGDLHCRVAQASGATVVAVSGHSGDRARKFADAHGIADATDDWTSLTSRDDIDLVVIGTPNSMHHPQAMEALRAGRHVLVDKPMAMNVAQADEMIDAAASADRVLAVGHMWRYRREVIALRDRIRAGKLGEIVRTRGYGIHAGWGPSGWFVDPALSGGGALIDMGIHAIDTTRFLLDDPEPVRTQASLGAIFRAAAVTDADAAVGSTASADNGRFIDDDSVLLIDWDQGTRSVIECGWWQPVLDGVEADVECFGTLGHERVWPEFTAATPPPPTYEHCSLEMYAAQMADVLACCSSGAVPVANAAVGRTALAIVEAAYDTARPSTHAMVETARITP